MNYENKPPVGNVEQNYIFISYSHKSSETVYDDLWFLSDHGVNYWYDSGIEPGENWRSIVEPKLKKATLAFVYIDENAFNSNAMENEIRCIKENNIPYFPIYKNKTYNKEKGKALASDYDVSNEREELFDSMFKTQSGILYDNADSYHNQMLDKISKYEVANTDITIDKGKSSTKVLVVAKNSLFSKAIKEGIQEGFENAQGYIVDYKLVKQEYQISENLMFFETINKNKDKYDIFILRPLGEIDDELFSLINEISKTKKIILLDIDLNANQRKRIQGIAPIFVSSDFEEGGKKLADVIFDTFFKLHSAKTYMLLCTGPNKKTALDRCNALTKELMEHDIYDFAKKLKLDDFNPEYATKQLTRYFNLEKENMVNYDNLILFAGNDNIASTLIKLYYGDCTHPLYQSLHHFKWILLCGYDGVKNIAGDSVLANNGLNYCTIDVVPKKQGLEVANIIKQKCSTSETIKVKPVVDKHIDYPYLPVRRLAQLTPILDKKKLFIFDLDGTIADTETLHWQAYNVLLKEYNVQLTYEDIKRYIGNSEISIYDMIDSDFGINIDKERFLHDRLKIYLDLVKETNLLPYDWVFDFMKTYPDANIMLLTSQVPDIVNYLLTYWHLDDVIPMDMRISAHNGKITKRDVFSNPGQYINMPDIDIEDVVVFEDSGHVADLAKSFGYNVVGIKHQYNKNSLSHFDYVIDKDHKEGLFVGICSLDVIYKDIINMPTEDVKIKSKDFAFAIGGPATKAALTYASMGGNATLITSIGQSPICLQLKELIRSQGVDVYDISMDANAFPNVSSIFINKPKATRTIVSGQNPAEYSDIISKINFSNFDFALYDCNLPKLTEIFVHKFKESNLPMVLDCGNWKDNIEYALDYADIIIASQTFKNKNNEDIMKLKNIYQIPKVAKTCGMNAILYNDGANTGELAVSPLTGVNTLGAGDVFHGAFCYYYFNSQLSFVEALDKASKYVHDYLEHND